MFFSTCFGVKDNAHGHENLCAHTDARCKLLVIDKEHGCDYNTVNWQI